MADQEHLNLLKQGVEVWNRWRKENPKIRPDFEGADLRGIDLVRVNLSDTNLNGAILNRVNLAGANILRSQINRSDLGAAYLSDANLSRASLTETNLTDANLSGATLFRVNLYQADLRRANLVGAVLSGATFNGANLIGADLSRANLVEANLDQASILMTIFGDTDLRLVKGLETLNHLGPSTIGIDTIYRSEGYIPEIFLRKAGIPNTFITYMRSLVVQPIDYYTCFISHSSQDQAFAERLYADLQHKGVRCWFAPEDLKIGDHYHQRIDESIRLYDKLILILSEHAIQSVWVEREVVAAREKEDREERPVLFPIRLDDAAMNTTKAWAADVRRRWHIGDFTQWKHHDIYQQAFGRLLHDLKAGTQR